MQLNNEQSELNGIGFDRLWRPLKRVLDRASRPQKPRKGASTEGVPWNPRALTPGFGWPETEADESKHTRPHGETVTSICALPTHLGQSGGSGC